MLRLMQYACGVMLLVLGAEVIADDGGISSAVPIRATLRMGSPLTADVVGKRMTISFKDNDRLSGVLREHLLALGYDVVPTGQEAEVRIELRGLFALKKGTAPAVTGSVGELLQHGLENAGSVETLKYENLPLRQIAVGTAVAKRLSVSDVLTYIGQRSGAAGWVNRAIVGNPQGVCLTNNCDTVVTTVAIMLAGEGGGSRIAWRVEESSSAQGVVLGEVIGDAITNVMRPFEDARGARSTGEAGAKTE